MRKINISYAVLFLIACFFLVIFLTKFSIADIKKKTETIGENIRLHKANTVYPINWCGKEKIAWIERGNLDDFPGGRLYISDVNFMNKIRVSNGPAGSFVTCTKDGKKLIYGIYKHNQSFDVFLYDISTKKSHRIFGEGDSVTDVFKLLSFNESLIVGPEIAKDEIKLWTNRSAKIAKVLKLSKQGLPKYYHLGWFANNREILMLDIASNKAGIYDITGELIRTVKIKDQYDCLGYRLSIDTKTLFYVCKDYSLRQWNLYQMGLGRNSQASLLLKNVNVVFDITHDGRSIVFTHGKTQSQGQYGLRLYNINNKKTHILTRNNDYGPSHSREGRHITFIRETLHKKTNEKSTFIAVISY